MSADEKVFFMRSQGVGTVYTFGSGQHGALGTGTFEASLNPTPILSVKNVVQIACGGEAILEVFLMNLTETTS